MSLCHVSWRHKDNSSSSCHESQSHILSDWFGFSTSNNFFKFAKSGKWTQDLFTFSIYFLSLNLWTTLTNRNEPGPSFQLYKWLCVYHDLLCSGAKQSNLGLKTRPKIVLVFFAIRFSIAQSKLKSLVAICLLIENQGPYLQIHFS